MLSLLLTSTVHEQHLQQYNYWLVTGCCTGTLQDTVLSGTTLLDVAVLVATDWLLYSNTTSTMDQQRYSYRVLVQLVTRHQRYRWSQLHSDQRLQCNSIDATYTSSTVLVVPLNSNKQCYQQLLYVVSHLVLVVIDAISRRVRMYSISLPVGVLYRRHIVESIQSASNRIDWIESVSVVLVAVTDESRGCTRSWFRDTWPCLVRVFHFLGLG